jgi:hypothetical protein
MHSAPKAESLSKVFIMISIFGRRGAMKARVYGDLSCYWKRRRVESPIRELCESKISLEQ